MRPASIVKGRISKSPGEIARARVIAAKSCEFKHRLGKFLPTSLHPTEFFCSEACALTDTALKVARSRAAGLAQSAFVQCPSSVVSIARGERGGSTGKIKRNR